MAQLRQDYQQFLDRNAEVVVVGPDSPADFRRYWEREALPFPGLADPGHQVANRYAQDVNLLKWGRMPALFVIDRQGLVRYAHYASSMSDIPTTAEVLQALDELRSDQSPLHG